MGMKQILETIIPLQFELIQQRVAEAEEAAKPLKEEEETLEGDDEIDEEGEGAFENDNDFAQLVAEAATARGVTADGEDDDDSDDEEASSSDDSEITEESEVTSPLDKVSELVVLLDTMKALANDQATYQAVWCQLSQPVQQQYQELAANCTQILQQQQQMAQALAQPQQHWEDSRGYPSVNQLAIVQY